MGKWSSCCGGQWRYHSSSKICRGPWQFGWPVSYRKDFKVQLLTRCFVIIHIQACSLDDDMNDILPRILSSPELKGWGKPYLLSSCLLMSCFHHLSNSLDPRLLQSKPHPRPHSKPQPTSSKPSNPTKTLPTRPPPPPPSADQAPDRYIRNKPLEAKRALINLSPAGLPTQRNWRTGCTTCKSCIMEAINSRNPWTVVSLDCYLEVLHVPFPANRLSPMFGLCNNYTSHMLTLHSATPTQANNAIHSTGAWAIACSSGAKPV